MAKSPGRSVGKINGGLGVAAVLDQFAETKKSYVASQMIESHKTFFRATNPSKDSTEITAVAYDLIERIWSDPEMRMAVLPGKAAISTVNQYLQDAFGVSISPSSIVEAMHVDEIFDEMRELVELLDKFSATPHRTPVRDRLQG